MADEKRLSPAELRKRRREEEEARLSARRERGLDLPPGVQAGESLDPRENPKVGPQDLSHDERVDLSFEKPEVAESYGYEEGMRVDQMDGVQSAKHPGNDVDPDEQLERNVERPPNLAVRDEYYGGDAGRSLPPSTVREVEAGKKAMQSRKESREMALDKDPASRIKPKAAGSQEGRTPASTLTETRTPDAARRGPGRPSSNK